MQSDLKACEKDKDYLEQLKLNNLIEISKLQEDLHECQKRLQKADMIIKSEDNLLKIEELTNRL